MGYKAFISASLSIGILCTGTTTAAQDTTRRSPRSVEVTSTFKPVLKDAAKINFNATPPNADTTRPRLQYSVPNQNLVFGYQPGTLKPMALAIDTAGVWDNESYVKAGFGSLKTPYLEAGLSLGDGKTAGLNVYARHLSSQGKLAFQEFSNTNVDLNAFFQTSGNIEWTGRFGGLQERYNKYGFQPDSLKFPEDSMLVRFQTWRGRIGFHNINRTAFGLSYAPELKVDVFSDRLGNSESNTYLNLPLHKTLGTDFAVDLAVQANLTRYKPEDRESINNNYLTIAPAVVFKNANLNIHAGIRPSFDLQGFKLFPNAMAEISSTDKRFTFQLGWIGHLRNSGFQYVAGMNPWIWAPATVATTRIEERYAGIKGSLGNHLSYSAKVGFHKLNNQPLFISDTVSGKSFQVVYEPQMKVLHLGSEIGFTVGEKFSLVSSFTFNQYNTLHENERAWGLIPLEFKTAVRLQVLKDLYLKSDLYAFDGPRYKTKDGRGNLPAAFDLNAGLEFAVVKNVKLWAQFNNIFNQQYQRWPQYRVYPFNFLGGIVFSFAQNNK